MVQKCKLIATFIFILLLGRVSIISAYPGNLDLISSIVRPVKSVFPPILQGVQQAAHSVSDAVGSADSKFTSAVKMGAWFGGGLATVAGCVLCYRSEIGSAASVVGCWQAVKNGLGIGRLEKGHGELKVGLKNVATDLQEVKKQQVVHTGILNNQTRVMTENKTALASVANTQGDHTTMLTNQAARLDKVESGLGGLKDLVKTMATRSDQEKQTERLERIEKGMNDLATKDDLNKLQQKLFALIGAKQPLQRSDSTDFVPKPSKLSNGNGFLNPVFLAKSSLIQGAANRKGATISGGVLSLPAD